MMEDRLRNEFIYKKLLETYESFRKNISKSDEHAKELKKSAETLKAQEKEICNIQVSSEKIRIAINDLFLATEVNNSKIIEKALVAWESLIMNDVLDSKIVNEGMKIVIKNIVSKSNIINDDTLMFKILNFCVGIYESNKVIISSNLLVNVIKIFFMIFLSQKNPYSQNAAKISITKLLKILVDKIEYSYNKVYNISNSNTNKLFRSSSNLINDDNEDNENYLRYCSHYLNNLTDIVEMNEKLNDNSENKNKNELMKDYIYTCTRSTDTYQEHCDQLEKHLQSLVEKVSDFSNFGLYGKCVNCFKPSTFFSEKVLFPFCSNNCEVSILKVKYNIDYKYSELNMYKDDFIISIKNLAKLSIKESKSPNNEITGLKLREFCLETIESLLTLGSRFFQGDQKLILVLKEHLVNSLITNILSSEERIFKLSISLFLTLLASFREHMKKEIYMFVSRVLIKILKSELLGYTHKETILDCFKRLSERSNFLLEIFSNFDCDVDYENVFSDLLDLLTKIIQGMYKSPKYSSLIKNNQEAVLRNKCLNILSSFLNNLANSIDLKETQMLNLNINSASMVKELTSSSVINIKENNNSNSNNNNSNNVLSTNENNNLYNYNNNYLEQTQMDVNFDANETRIEDNNEELIGKMNHNLKLKNIFSTAVEKFNISYKKCQSFLIKNDIFSSEKLFNQIKDKVIFESKEITTNINTNVTNVAHVIEKNFNNNISSNNNSNYNFNTITTITYNNLKDMDINELTNYTFESYQASELVSFIKSNLKEINTAALGQFLCGSKSFSKLCLTKFIDSYNFTNLHIFDAMKLLFMDFKIEGEGQIVDRIMQIFGEKYTKDNPTMFPNPDIAYYLGFSIMMLQTDLHRPEVTDKMSSQKFEEQFALLSQGELKAEFLNDVYNRVLVDPIKIPGQKLVLNSNQLKNKKDLIKMEKESIIKSTYDSLNIISKDLYDFSIYIDNEHVKNMINSNWTYFLSTFATLLTETHDDTILLRTCCENILNLAKLAGYLKLDTIAEAFVNTIFQKTNLFEGRDMNVKNFECIKHIIEFYAVNGIYMNVGWLGVLAIISKIEYYHNLTSEFKNEQELFIQEVKRKHRKFPEKEIEIEFRNADIVSKSFSIVYCDNIFSSTATFSAEGIINFISALCEVSKNELSSPINPRNYSLHKLIEVADYNLLRIQIQWAKIWKILSEHIVYVVKNYHTKNIAVDAVDSLRQIVSKLLQKSDLAIYHFQIDFFKPFEAIFNIENISTDRSELILNCLAFIVSSSKNIHAGWIIIFNIIKVCFKKKDDKLNEEGMKLLNIISEDFALVNQNSNQEVFKGYIECLCHMYLDKNLKKTAFETMLNVMNKVYLKQVYSSNKISNVNLSTDKKYEFLKVFFYGIDDLLNINIIEHLNLLFEIISYNSDIFFSNDPTSFIYLYYSYFKPCVYSCLVNKSIKIQNRRQGNSNGSSGKSLDRSISNYFFTETNNENNYKENKDNELFSNSPNEINKEKENNNNRKESKASNTNIAHSNNNENSITARKESISNNINNSTIIKNDLGNILINQNISVIYKNSEQIKNYLIHSLQHTIEDPSHKNLIFIENSINGADSKIVILNFLKQITKAYDQDFELLLKKQQVLSKFKLEDIEEYLIELLNKFYNLISNYSDESKFNYSFFFEDLIQLIISYTSYSECSDFLFNIILKKLFNNDNKENKENSTGKSSNMFISKAFWEKTIDTLKLTYNDLFTAHIIKEENEDKKENIEEKEAIKTKRVSIVPHFSQKTNKHKFIQPYLSFIISILTKSTFSFPSSEFYYFYNIIDYHFTDLLTKTSIILEKEIKTLMKAKNASYSNNNEDNIKNNSLIGHYLDGDHFNIIFICLKELSVCASFQKELSKIPFNEKIDFSKAYNNKSIKKNISTLSNIIQNVDYYLSLFPEIINLYNKRNEGYSKKRREELFCFYYFNIIESKLIDNIRVFGEFLDKDTLENVFDLFMNKFDWENPSLSKLSKEGLILMKDKGLLVIKENN